MGFKNVADLINFLEILWTHTLQTYYNIIGYDIQIKQQYKNELKHALNINTCKIQHECSYNLNQKHQI